MFIYQASASFEFGMELNQKYNDETINQIN